MDRMDTESQTPHHRARSERAQTRSCAHASLSRRVDQSPRQERDERGVQRVEQEASEVEAARVHSAKDEARGEAQPREWHVVTHQCARERPQDVISAKATERHVAYRTHVVVQDHELTDVRWLEA